MYFSIITQALTYAAMLLFFRNETGFGGNNGFTDFKAHPGLRHHQFRKPAVLFGSPRWPSAAATLVLAAWLVKSKFGRVLTAIRDAESRVMFIGYKPALVQAHHLDRVGGAVRHRRSPYVPRWASSNPSEMSPANSIEIAIWVAVGGRGTSSVLSSAPLSSIWPRAGFHRELPGILAVLPWPAVHRRHPPSPSPRAWSASGSHPRTSPAAPWQPHRRPFANPPTGRRHPEGSDSSRDWDATPSAAIWTWSPRRRLTWKTSRSVSTDSRP